jgi:hypothetical protein
MYVANTEDTVPGLFAIERVDYVRNFGRRTRIGKTTAQRNECGSTPVFSRSQSEIHHLFQYLRTVALSIDQRSLFTFGTGVGTTSIPPLAAGAGGSGGTVRPVHAAVMAMKKRVRSMMLALT